MTGNGQHQFSYDEAQNLRCIDCNSSNAIHYQYDTDNMRFRQVKKGLNTYFIYASNGNLLMEYTPAKGEYKLYGYVGDKLIATVTQTKPDLDMDGDGRQDAIEINQRPSTTIATTHKLEYFNTDAVGSPIIVSDFDQRYSSQPWHYRQGRKGCDQNYYPYGERRITYACPDNELWFAGKMKDDDTGLSYFGARYYDPAVGRFMGIDPVQPNVDNLHSLNRYAYANNNPYRYIDPDGREPLTIAAVVVGVATLAGYAYDAYEGYQPCRKH